MAEVQGKLGHAEFKARTETAANGLAEACDGLMGVLKDASANKAALLADGVKLSAKYGILEEVMAFQQLLKADAGGGHQFGAS